MLSNRLRSPRRRASGTTQMSSSDGCDAQKAWYGGCEQVSGGSCNGLARVGAQIRLSLNTLHFPIAWDCFLFWLLPASTRRKLSSSQNVTCSGEAVLGRGEGGAMQKLGLQSAAAAHSQSCL